MRALVRRHVGRPSRPALSARAMPPPALAASLAALLALLVASPPPRRPPPPRLHPPRRSAAPARRRSGAGRAYWTPERMRTHAARPRRRLRRRPVGAATRSPAPASSPSPRRTSRPTPSTAASSSASGDHSGYCSGTAINSPTRQLVLTAGHCVNSGPRGRRGSSVWSRLPASSSPPTATASPPSASFVARRSKVFAPKQWIKHGNPDFDLGAFLTLPNADGVNVADAVGGGATIALDLTRQQDFQTFGYPGRLRRMQGCDSPYVGDDPLTYPFPGPPTLGIRCHWAPGASGGGWLIDDGTQINGLNSLRATATTGPHLRPLLQQRNRRQAGRRPLSRRPQASEQAR